jgi:hypothetical protein
LNGLGFRVHIFFFFLWVYFVLDSAGLCWFVMFCAGLWSFLLLFAGLGFLLVFSCFMLGYADFVG